jgi:Family of unknown function (DUF6152)
MQSRTIGGLMVGMLAMATPAFAHHSFADYDAKTIRTVTGTVKSFHWSNPHVTFTVLVRSADGGKLQEWNIVTSAPNILKRFDWTGASVNAGDRVTLVCNPLSDGSYGGRLHTLTNMSSGKVLKTKLSPNESD